MRVRLNAFLISIMITVLIFTSIAGIGTAQSSIPKPSVPEFTVKLVSYPYDVPPTTTTTVDPYTGKETVTTQPGYHVENKSIELIIKNQPVTPHTDAEGHMINLYYNVRVKGHFEDPWRELYSIDELMREERGAHKQGPVQSSFEYTVISCSADYPDDGEVDFQVQALAGYYTEWWPALADRSNGTLLARPAIGVTHKQYACLMARFQFPLHQTLRNHQLQHPHRNQL